MKTLIISGKSGSGKDTLANYLKEKIQEQGQKCIILHYADPVKWLARECYNWDGIKDEHGRSLLQHLGTDTVRKLFPDFWTLFVSQFLNAVSNDFDYAIIPDARFPNEIEISQYYTNGCAIRVVRKDEEGNEYINHALTPEQRQHPSETSLDDYMDYDYIVENIDGKEELLKDAAEIILEDY